MPCRARCDARRPAHRRAHDALRDLFSPEPSCQALQFRHPVRFGRPRKPWPTCHCAWRCARTAATKFAGSRGVVKRALQGYCGDTRGVLYGYTATGVHTGQCEARNALPSLERAFPAAGSSARARMTEYVVAGARAARDGAARTEPATAADGRCRCAARRVGGGADLAAVGAARDGLPGDREAQGASPGKGPIVPKFTLGTQVALFTLLCVPP
jgi:hypothetical protein